MARVPDSIAETWNGYVNQGAQEFMNLSRYGQRDITLVQAAHEYVAQINYMFNSPEDHLSDEQLADVEAAMIRYLELTQGEEWE